MIYLARTLAIIAFLLTMQTSFAQSKAHSNTQPEKSLLKEIVGAWKKRARESQYLQFEIDGTVMIPPRT